MDGIISNKRRKIIVGNDESPLMIPMANKCKFSRNRKRSAPSNAVDSGNNVNGQNNNSKRRLRILLEAANQVTDDEGDSYVEEDNDHHQQEGSPNKEPYERDEAAVQVPPALVLNIHRHEYRFPAYLPIGRPLAAPPRLPSVPLGYKFTTAIIGQ